MGWMRSSWVFCCHSHKNEQEIEHSRSEQLSLTATTTQKNQNIKSSCFCCFTCIYSSDRASRWGYSVVVTHSSLLVGIVIVSGWCILTSLAAKQVWMIDNLFFLQIVHSLACWIACCWSKWPCWLLIFASYCHMIISCPLRVPLLSFLKCSRHFFVFLVPW
jgi:hypothetical protein